MGQYTPGQNGLTNNFRANMAILTTVAGAYLALSIFRVGDLRAELPLPGETPSKSSIAHFAVFAAAYFLASYWFSPDLDLRRYRPGHHSFPLKGAIGILNRARKSVPIIGPAFGMLAVAFAPLHEILNRAWRLFWHPFGHVFTHRGAVHWPLVGTQLKILYAFAAYWLSATLLSKAGVFDKLPFASGDFILDVGLDGGLYSWIVSTPLLTSAWIGAMVADICHSTVDFWDSAKKGSRFVPPEAIAPRGILLSTWRFFGKRIFGR